MRAGRSKRRLSVGAVLGSVAAAWVLGGATCVDEFGGGGQGDTLEKRVANLERLALQTRERHDADLAGLREQTAELSAELERLREEIRAARGIADERAEGIERRLLRIERLADRAAARPESAAPAAAKEGPEAWTSAAQGLTEARAKFEAKDFARARELYATVLQRYPDADEAAEALWGVGESYFQLGEYAQAVIHFDRLTKNHPKSERVASSLLRIAECFEKLGQPEDAKLFYQHVVAEFPQSPEAKTARAKLGR